MRNLAMLIATGWFWLLFIYVGPLTSTSEIVTGVAVLLAGCLVFALWGTLGAQRTLMRLGAAQTDDRRQAAGIEPRNDRCASSMRSATSSDEPATRCSNPPTR